MFLQPNLDLQTTLRFVVTTYNLLFDTAENTKIQPINVFFSMKVPYKEDKARSCFD